MKRPRPDESETSSTSKHQSVANNMTSEDTTQQQQAEAALQTGDTSPLEQAVRSIVRLLKIKQRGNKDIVSTNADETERLIEDHIRHHKCGGGAVAKMQWTELGNLVAEREQLPLVRVEGNYWISLRLDGAGFGKHIKHLQRVVGMNSGHIGDFAAVMRRTLECVMKQFNAKIGFTQSDEMTILMPPRAVIRGVQDSHLYSGRVQKLSTMAASLVTSCYSFYLGEVLEAKYSKSFQTVFAPKAEGGIPPVPMFDCRVGRYASYAEALSVLIWRAYDCSINSVSDAVHHCKVAGKKQVVKQPTLSKIRWLATNNLLPLPKTQKIGTLLVSAKREHVGFNPKTKENCVTTRSKLVEIEMSILDAFLECETNKQLAEDTNILESFPVDSASKPHHHL